MRRKNTQSSSPFGEVRLIAGHWRSRKLKVPTALGLRPTTDRVRETVFNWLQYDINNSICLDACAGSGALGFEALSRGAAAVHFVETQVKAMQTLRGNAQSLGAKESQQVWFHQQAIESFLAQRNTEIPPFNLVFVDPPFELGLHESIFTALQAGDWLAEDALIYCEMPSQEKLKLPESWEWYRQKSYKNVSFGLIAV